MQYILGTGIVSRFYNKRLPEHGIIKERIASLQRHKLCVSVLTLCELEFGRTRAEGSEKERLKTMLQKIEETFIVLPLFSNVSPLFGELKEQVRLYRKTSLENMKKHTIDILLASTTIVEECTFVGIDRIFKDIQHLRDDFLFENWSQSRENHQ